MPTSAGASILEATHNSQQLIKQLILSTRLNKHQVTFSVKCFTNVLDMEFQSKATQGLVIIFYKIYMPQKMLIHSKFRMASLNLLFQV